MTISPSRTGPLFTKAGMSGRSWQCGVIDHVNQLVWDRLIGTGTSTKDLNHG
jgi:hypothetical protein